MCATYGSLKRKNYWYTSVYIQLKLGICSWEFEIIRRIIISNLNTYITKICCMCKICWCSNIVRNYFCNSCNSMKRLLSSSTITSLLETGMISNFLQEVTLLSVDRILSWGLGSLVFYLYYFDINVEHNDGTMMHLIVATSKGPWLILMLPAVQSLVAVSIWSSKGWIRCWCWNFPLGLCKKLSTQNAWNFLQNLPRWHEETDTFIYILFDFHF